MGAGYCFLETFLGSGTNLWGVGILNLLKCHGDFQKLTSQRQVEVSLNGPLSQMVPPVRHIYEMTQTFFYQTLPEAQRTQKLTP